MSDIICPLTFSKVNKVLQENSTDEIIQFYKNAYNIDVHSYFHGIDSIKLYENIESKFQFFYPLTTAGDDYFYDQLSKLPWYYLQWKWEYGYAQNLIENNQKVLEIGCGNGHFIDHLSITKKIDATGLELNKKAVISCKKKKLDVANKTIQEFADSNDNTFDVVCSFQVVEHIAGIHSFLKSSVKILKQGGKFIISCPNNDSFLKYIPEPGLDNPPHHMNRWTKEVFEYLPSIFDVELLDIVYEPLQEEHYRTFISILLSNNLILSKIKILKKIAYRIVLPFYLPYLRKKSHKIIGHTILAVFMKR